MRRDHWLSEPDTTNNREPVFPGFPNFGNQHSDRYTVQANLRSTLTSNLVNEFNILFRGTGQNNHSYDIYGQGRYGSNPYDDFDMYWDQSPISGVRTMDTPLLYTARAQREPASKMGFPVNLMNLSSGCRLPH